MNAADKDSILSKDFLETANSLAWFFMDAAWMLEIKPVANAMILPTLASGIALCAIEKEKSAFYINMSVASWIVMNVSWMLAESFAYDAFMAGARAFFVVGSLFLCLAAAKSKNLKETFSHFKRFRIGSYLK